MDSLLSTPYFRDDLLDFTDFDTDTDNNPYDAVPSSHKRRRVFSLLPCTELVEEEELEWISNKDAFPMVESFVDIVPNHPNIHSANSSHGSHLSPVSVLENNGLFPMSVKKCRENGSSFCSENSSVCNDGIGAVISLTGSFKVPGRARSKRLRKLRREISEEQWSRLISSKTVSKPDTGLKCLHCGSEKTPQWRTGPLGPKTLCNACGVRYKSGRLVPEYRPASSPTFSSELHSNSHRKVVEMRRQKIVGVVGSELKAVEFS